MYLIQCTIMIRFTFTSMLILTFMSCSFLSSKKRIAIKKIPAEIPQNFKSVSTVLEEKTKQHPIDTRNWASFPYAPEVSFRIAHNSKAIFLKFYVKEQHLLAKRDTTNSATHKDSCVEFFIDPLQNGNYFNFEFNCIGTTHLAYGTGRKKRTFIPPERIEKHIQTWSTLGDQPFKERSGSFKWEMVVIIDTAVMFDKKSNELSGQIAHANFYKCGDDTAKPHYLSWNPVITERPDFHRPDHFGLLEFE